MRYLILIIFIGGLNIPAVLGQEIESGIRKGNELYREKKYDKAEAAYNEVIARDPNNFTARFNKANALYRANKVDQAAQSLNDLIAKDDQQTLAAKTYYNKGVMLSNQKKLEESIEAYKESLRQDPTDKEVRENLQKALLELKKKNPQQKKEDNKPQPKKQPQPKMNQKEAEQRLKLLEQKEKDVQQRLQKEKSKQGGGQPKDW